MTVQDIFAKLSSHMVEGMMLHEQMANYYDFLGLRGYKRCHEYHYLCETLNHRKVNRYYINHYDKLVAEEDIKNPKRIPSSWFRYTRHDVDGSTKRNAVKAGLEAWIEWERSTRDLYTEFYQELLDMGEISSACELKCLIQDVDCELKYAYRKQLNLISVEYSMSDIILAQDDLHDKYKNEMEKLKTEL